LADLRSRRLACRFGVAVSLLAGCASIQVFEVSPRLACPGDTVHLTWAASGRVTLDTPSQAGTEQPSAGTLDVTLQRPARFTLEAHRLFKDASAEADVEVAPPDKGFAEVARCDPAARWLEASFVLESQLSSTIQVGRVRNVSERPLVVLREGHELTLAAACVGETSACGADSEVLRGHVARGRWVLRSPLADAETCEAALRSVRQYLQVELQLRCGA
jgi:hypothetical protein